MALATADDVATRLGRILTTAEEASAELVIEVVTGLLADATSKTSAQLDTLALPALRLIVIEKAVSAIVNPENVASLSEQLGAYQHSQTFPRASDVGIYLTDTEERLARRAVWGTNTGSVRLGSIFEEVES